MVKYTKPDFDRILFAISDSTRRGIVDELVRGERSVGELAEPYKMSLPAITKHIRVLHETGLIKTRKRGRHVICSLEPENLMRIETWLSKYHRFWADRLQELEKLIRTNKLK
jgi:DNA-binding transcriptional ArsR family regulator